MTHGLLCLNRNYRLLLSSSAVTRLCDGVAAVAMPWLATLLTRDPLMISIVAMAEYLPWCLFTLPAGVWTDRADRRRLMIWADCGRMGLMCCVVAMALSIPASSVPSSNRTELVAALVAVAFLLGTAAVVRGNAAQTLLPSIVGRENLERANGQMWSAEQALGRFVGPPLAGALIAAGIVMPFAFNAVTLALVIGIVWLIALPVRRSTEHKRFWPALLEGLGWHRTSAPSCAVSTSPPPNPRHPRALRRPTSRPAPPARQPARPGHHSDTLPSQAAAPKSLVPTKPESRPICCDITTKTTLHCPTSRRLLRNETVRSHHTAPSSL